MLVVSETKQISKGTENINDYRFSIDYFKKYPDVKLTDIKHIGEEFPIPRT
jgi:hypothetical protein